MIIKGIEQDFYFVSAEDGEVYGKAERGSSISIRSPQQVANDKYYSSPMAINKKFVKVMNDEEQVLDILGSNHKAYFVLVRMRKYLVPNQNTLMKDGKKLKITDIAREMGISKQACSVHFNRLKKARLIAECECKGGKIWTMNPFYYMAGQTVPKRIVDLYTKH